MWHSFWTFNRQSVYSSFPIFLSPYHTNRVSQCATLGLLFFLNIIISIQTFMSVSKYASNTITWTNSPSLSWSGNLLPQSDVLYQAAFLVHSVYQIKVRNQQSTTLGNKLTIVQPEDCSDHATCSLNHCPFVSPGVRTNLKICFNLS